MFANRLKKLRSERGLTQKELGDIVSLSKQAISGYEHGSRNPDPQTLHKLADFFNCTVDYLLGRTNSKKIDLVDILESDKLPVAVGSDPITQTQRLKVLHVLDNSDQPDKPTNHVPILGTIKAGIPILSEENYDGELEIPSDMDGDFAVEVSGDSMIGAGINPGDFVICKQSQTAYNKDIVAAVRHGEVTLKYFIENNGHDRPVLRAANPEYEDIPIDEDTRIEGIKTALIRKESTPYHRYQEYIAIRDKKLQGWDEVIEMAINNGMDPDFIKGILSHQITMAKRFANKKFFSS